MNEDALFYYLSFLTTPAPQTLFAGIQKLPPATYLKITADGKQEQHTYWDVLEQTNPLINVSEAEIAERVLAELETSVKLRMESDVPVGVFLSGGIDSSTNAALIARNSTQPVHTFSIGYDENYKSYPSELNYAWMMAKKIGSQHHEYLINVDDLVNFLPQMVKLQDEPLADPVCVPVYYVAKLAREHGVTVCQVGEGADELFWGYPSWKIKLQLQQLSVLPGTAGIQRLALHGLNQLGKSNSLHYELLRRGVAQQPVWGGAEAFTAHQKMAIFSPRLQEKYKHHSAFTCIEPVFQRFQEKAWDTHWLNWMSYLDLNFRLPELLLMRVDKMTMGVGVEGRVPFLDHRFVELAMSIPAKLKTKQGILKHILKQPEGHHSLYHHKP